MSEIEAKEQRAIAASVDRACEAPILNYQAPQPKQLKPRIGLIGCGGITHTHLSAYQNMGWDVVAMCDLHLDSAKAKAEQYYPEANIYSDYHDLLKDNSIDVVDITLHPAPRVKAIEAALQAGKHILSQKPFALDVETAERLAQMADDHQRKLAINQNGRWAPYVSYARQLIKEGLLGDIQSVNIHINWDHTNFKGTAFEEVHHLVLYDFGIHWFDMTQQFFGDQKAKTIFASNAFSSHQDMKPPLLANVAIQYPHGVANLCFDAHSTFGKKESLVITGSKGTFRASGDTCVCADIDLITAEGISHPKLEGQWFPDGFAGAMGELLCSIEEDRNPVNSAWNNIDSLKLCFSALKSSDEGHSITVN